MDAIDWLMKPGGQNVLVEILCSTKECNIRTQQKSTDSRLLTYAHNCFSISFRNAQGNKAKKKKKVTIIKNKSARQISCLIHLEFKSLLGSCSEKPLQDMLGRECAAVHLMDKGQSGF